MFDNLIYRDPFRIDDICSLLSSAWCTAAESQKTFGQFLLDFEYFIHHNYDDVNCSLYSLDDDGKLYRMLSDYCDLLQSKEE